MATFQSMSETELLQRAGAAARHAMRARTGNGFAYFFRMAVETNRELEQRAETRATVAAMLASVPESNAHALAMLAQFGRAFTMTTGTGTETGCDDSGDGGAKVPRKPRKPQPPTGNKLAALFAANLNGRV